MLLAHCQQIPVCLENMLALYFRNIIRNMLSTELDSAWNNNEMLAAWGKSLKLCRLK